jgi:hypothetical protein
VCSLAILFTTYNQSTNPQTIWCIFCAIITILLIILLFILLLLQTIHPPIHTQEESTIILDFSEAQAKMKEEENRRRVEEGLATGLTKEVSENEKNERRLVFVLFCSIRWYY